MKTRRSRRKQSASKKWAVQHRKLMALRLKLLAQDAERSAEFRNGNGAPDPSDRAERIEEGDELLAGIHRDEVELSEIDDALRRIYLGTYGTCESTGRRIPAARLRALPWTRYTLEAARVREASISP